MTALLFPGQGAQFVGMGKTLADAFPAARATFEEADDILGESLSAVMWSGEPEELTVTRNAQPAILTHSVAALRVMNDAVDDVAFAAGHSLGEFSAHVAAGTLSFADALVAVRVRGDAMTEAGLLRPGTMAAVLGMEDAQVEAICEEASTGGEVVVPANFNSDGQVVISGDVAAVERATEMLRGRGAKRVLALNVSGAFHSPLMAPAEAALAKHLAGVDFEQPTYPVVANVTAEPVAAGQVAIDLLVTQLTSPVRWTESMRKLVSSGVQRFVELGPGSVLSGLCRRNAKGIPARSLGEPGDFDGLARS